MPCCEMHSGIEQRIRSLEDNMSRINTNEAKMLECQASQERRTTVLEENFKMTVEKVMDFGEYVKGITELTYTVKSIVEQNAEILKQLATHNTRLVVLEQKDGNMALNSWKYIIKTVAAVAIGALLGMYFKK